MKKIQEGFLEKASERVLRGISSALPGGVFGGIFKNAPEVISQEIPGMNKVCGRISGVIPRGSGEINGGGSGSISGGNAY